MSRAGAARTGGKPARTLFGHPPGLTVLFTTQMWAEFSFFGLQALLVYYMTKHLGFSQAKSSLIYGAYGAAAFFSPFFGGLIADRWLGRTKAVTIGATMMMFGHFAMAFEALLFPALALVALGNGLFMPPLATQVGSLYADDDPRKAYAYSAYYMGINLGGFLAPLVCGTLGELYGWHWGFAAAGVGMADRAHHLLSSLRLLPPEPTIAGPGREPVNRRNSDRCDQRTRALPARRDGRAVPRRLRTERQRDRPVGRGPHRPVASPLRLRRANSSDLVPVDQPSADHCPDAGPDPHLAVARRRTRNVPHLLRRMSFGCILAGLAMLLMVLAASPAVRTAPGSARGGRSAISSC